MDEDRFFAMVEAKKIEEIKQKNALKNKLFFCRKKAFDSIDDERLKLIKIFLGFVEEKENRNLLIAKLIDSIDANNEREMIERVINKENHKK